jgi:adenosylcobinamide-GDP ribazoletransferase
LLTLVLAPAGAGLAAAFAGAIGCLVIVEIARRQIGGYTGDVLGAAEQVVECLVLTAIAAAA